MKILSSAFVLLFSFVAFAQTPPTSSTQPLRRLNIKARVVPAAKDTAQRFNDKLKELKDQLASEKDLRKRYSLYANGVDQLAAIKESGPRPDDEQKALEMALVVDTLDNFPSGKNFNAAHCQDQYAATQSRMTASAEPEPGVQKGLEILKMVCGK